MGIAEPLNTNFPIINPDGTPTEYFIRWAQQFSSNALPVDGITGGSGISVSPGPTISADQQAILDAIDNTQGSILYRDADEWKALAPGTAGHFLKTNGVAANPEWAAAGGGGGSAAWNIITTWDFDVDGATALVTADIAGYSDILVTCYNVTISTSAWRVFRVSTDNGATFISTGYVSLSSTGTATNTDTSGFMHATASAAARNCMCFLKGANVNGQKFYETVRDNNVAFVGTPTTPPLTNINVYPTSGNFNGGVIRILAR